MIAVAEKSGFADAEDVDFVNRNTCTSTSNATVMMSPAQNHGLIQRGSVWSSKYSASAMHTASSGTTPASD